MTHSTLIPSLALLVLLGACAPAAPVADSTPAKSASTSTPTDLALPSKPYPLPTTASSTPAAPSSTDPATDAGAGAPAAPSTTKAAAPKTTGAAPPRTTVAAPPAPPKTTAAATVWVAYSSGGSGCERNVQTGTYRGCTSWIKLTGCTYNASTGKTLGTWNYFSPSTSTKYTLTINGHTFPPVSAGIGPGPASATGNGPGTACSATISG